MKRFILLSVAAVACVFASGYTATGFKLTDSAIYPATVRDVTVTVPDAYRSGMNAGVFVGLDGILCNAPEVIDSLIASGEMPVTVGGVGQPSTVRYASGKVMRF